MLGIFLINNYLNNNKRKMKIEQQVCNLELAKKLKELGVEQDSHFWYKRHILNETIIKLDDIIEDDIERTKIVDREYIYLYPAFTAIELLEMLPEFTGRELTIKRGNNCYLVYYDKNSIGAITDNEHISDQLDESLCNALAKMLCYLKENNLIKTTNIKENARRKNKTIVG